MLTKVQNLPHLDLVVYFLTISVIIFTLGKDLLPFQKETFSFHDNTQYARVQQYSKQLQAFEIPPKFAPDMNFGLGYPIFLFYAPLAYIIASIFNLIGVGTVESVRITFLTLWIIGASGIYFWVRSKGNSQASSLFASALYSSSPWWASEMFVRGNLATASFLAFAPWAFWAVLTWRKQPQLSILAISLSLISHNALSLLFIPIILGYSIFVSRHDRKSRFIFMIVSILTSSWFWIPSLLQLPSTYAQEVATMIKYQDHFLCIHQIWTTDFWGYGASMRGCSDGMSFMVGKLQIILFLAGSVSAILYFKKHLLTYFELLTVLVIVFMTLADSTPIWNLFPFLHAIQFPWRLLALGLPIIASGSAHFFNFITQMISQLLSKLTEFSIYQKMTLLDPRLEVSSSRAKSRDPSIPVAGGRDDDANARMSTQKRFIELACILIFGVAIALSSAKFFAGQKVQISEITDKYVSKDYISNLAAYEAPEYIPKTVNRDFWLQFRGENIDSESRSILNMQMRKFSPNPVFQIIGFIITGVAVAYNLWIHTKKTQS